MKVCRESMIALLDIASYVAWALALSSGEGNYARQSQVMPTHGHKALQKHSELTNDASAMRCSLTGTWEMQSR